MLWKEITRLGSFSYSCVINETTYDRWNDTDWLLSLTASNKGAAYFFLSVRPMVYLEFGFENSHIKGALPGYILFIRSVIIAWGLRSVFFLFPFSQSRFVIFLNFFFSECMTQSERDHYCFNGGTCFRIPSLGNDPYCQCTIEFIGRRCEMMALRPDV